MILAAGEGSRLAADGVEEPKALVPIGGVPQVVRLARTLRALGCGSALCVLREDLAPRLAALRDDEGTAAPLACLPVRTPSSLHSLVLGLDALPDGPVFCSMVDTVMALEDWPRVYGASVRALRDGAAAALAVTPDTGGESPLYAAVDPLGRVLSLRDDPPAPFVTGGVYAFAPEARAVAREAVESGLHRMRAFLRLLVERGRPVHAVTAGRIIDLDRSSDLREADRLLGASSPD